MGSSASCDAALTASLHPRNRQPQQQLPEQLGPVRRRRPSSRPSSSPAFSRSARSISSRSTADAPSLCPCSDRVRFLLFTGLWTFFFSFFYLFGFLKATTSFLFSIASHVAWLFLTWVFWCVPLARFQARTGCGRGETAALVADLVRLLHRCKPGPTQELTIPPSHRLAGTAAFAASLGGSLDCGNYDAPHCHTLNALEAFGWINFVVRLPCLSSDSTVSLGRACCEQALQGVKTSSSTSEN